MSDSPVSKDLYDATTIGDAVMPDANAKITLCAKNDEKMGEWE